MRIDDRALYCYLTGAAVRQLLADGAVVDAILAHLDRSGSPEQARSLDAAEKLAAMERAIEAACGAEGSTFRGVDAAEVFAASVWRAASRKVVALCFNRVQHAKSLLLPVAAWLRHDQGLAAHADVRIGPSHIDIMGHRSEDHPLGGQIVAVALVNAAADIDRRLDAIVAHAQYAHRVYVACTPYTATEYLQRVAESSDGRRFTPGALNDKLTDAGVGLLVVRMVSSQEAEVDEVVLPRRGAPESKRLKEVLQVLETRTS